MLRVLASAHGCRFAVTSAVVGCLLTLLGRGRAIPVPLVNDPVPVVVVVVVSVPVIAIRPLISAMAELEATLPRSALLRVFRLAATAALAALPPTIAVPSTPSDPSLWREFIVLLALAIVAVVHLGELAWTVPLSVGLLTVIVDGSHPSHPVSGSLAQVGLGPLAAGLLASGALYVRHGPRHTG